ncbi:hypothetical protein C8Q76DRAFT_755101 [Earliella scabrosa]|nr:hypothetical protein C8Q76DRAFT_755101 [Earliella scabrosa]
MVTQDIARYSPYKHLWKAPDVRLAEMEAEVRRKDEKRMCALNAYNCVAAGCGIGDNQKSAGRCPDERKPYQRR